MTDFQPLIHEWYFTNDYNCARVTLMCLAKEFGVELQPQALHAAIGMHGAGRFRAQCGLVEGALMFLGIYGAAQGKSDKDISKLCFRFAKAFTAEFGSLTCSGLRPGGFQKTDPPHACEPLTNRTVPFAAEFIRANFQ